MKIISIGSKFFDDAVIATQINIKNVGRITDISPFVFSHNCKQSVLKNENENRREKDYFKFLARFDISGGKNISELDYDKVVLDVLDMRMIYHEWILSNGEIVRVSESSKRKYEEEILREILKDKKLTVIEKKEVNPLSLSDEELKKNIICFVEWITKNLDLKKIYFLKNELAIQYINLNSEVNFVSNYKGIQKLNVFFGKCIDIVRKHVEVKWIQAPIFNLADARNKELNFFSSSYSYYKYFVSSILGKENVEDYLACYENEIYDLICEKSINESIEILRKNIRKRKIIMVGDSKRIREELIKKNGTENIKIIDNYSWIDAEKLKLKIENILRESEQECYWIITRIYSCNNILKLLDEYNLEKFKDYIVISNKNTIYRNFCGNVKDIFNNKIKCENPTDIVLEGWGNIVESYAVDKIQIILESGNYIKIEEFVKSHPSILLKLKCEDEAVIIIGKRTSYMASDSIIASSFSKIEIGKDCLFSSEIKVKTLKKRELVNKKHNHIIIGDAVWIGYRCYIMSGTNINTGCVLGARTSVWDCDIPNNCIVVGEPGKIVRKDIVWDADMFKHSLIECVDEYVQRTKEEEI